MSTKKILCTQLHPKVNTWLLGEDGSGFIAKWAARGWEPKIGSKAYLAKRLPNRTKSDVMWEIWEITIGEAPYGKNIPKTWYGRDRTLYARAEWCNGHWVTQLKKNLTK